MSKAIYAGSFDPLTNGHIEIVNRALGMFDELVIVVAGNPAKAPMFSLEERKTMIEGCVDRKLPKWTSIIGGESRVTVITLENKYVAAYAQENGIYYLVRGLRDSMDFHMQGKIYWVNKLIAPQVETVFFMTNGPVAEISSSDIKGLLGCEGWEDQVSPLVPENVMEAIVKKVSKR